MLQLFVDVNNTVRKQTIMLIHPLVFVLDNVSLSKFLQARFTGGIKIMKI